MIAILYDGFETARTDKDGEWEIRVNGTYVRLNDLITALGSLQSRLSTIKAEIDPFHLCSNCITTGVCATNRACARDQSTGPWQDKDD